MESPKVEKAEVVRRTGRAKGAEDVLDAFERNIGLHADGNEGFSEIRRVRDEGVQRRISTGKVPPIPDPASDDEPFRSDGDPQDIFERGVPRLVPRIVKDELAPDSVEFENRVEGNARSFVREKIAASGNRFAERLERGGVHFRERRIRIRIEHEGDAAPLAAGRQDDPPGVTPETVEVFRPDFDTVHDEGPSVRNRHAEPLLPAPVAEPQHSKPRPGGDEQDGGDPSREPDESFCGCVPAHGSSSAALHHSPSDWPRSQTRSEREGGFGAWQWTSEPA